MEQRNAELGNHARAGAPAGARALRPDAALGEPVRQPARDRRGRRARADAVACRRRCSRSRSARSPGTCCSASPGAIGADARVPGMVLLRAPLGRRGSYAPTVLNVAQNLGWSTFELIIISTAAAALSERVFGFRERWLWALLFGAISLAARAAGADRLRPPLPEEVRRLGGRGVDRLPDLVGARQGEPARALAPAGRRRRLARPGDRPRDRQHHLLDAARRRLHALRARPAQRLLRHRGRLPAADVLVLRDRLAARALAQPERADADPDRGRHRQRARGASRC